MVSSTEAKEIALHLKGLYAKLIEENKNNKVFGEPENFIQFLSKEEYNFFADEIPFHSEKDKSSTTSVIMGIETGESQINIDELKAHLQNEIENQQNITFKPFSEVIKISPSTDYLGYNINYKNSFQTNTITSSMLVNCTWQNIEKLDRTIGVNIPDDNQVNRIKLSVLVELPNTLRNFHTLICSSGPFISITVLPDGCAILTSERITNVDFYHANDDFLPEELQQKIDIELKINHQVGLDIAMQILCDCASEMNESVKKLFMKSIIKDLRVGYVKMMKIETKYDNDDIYKKESHSWKTV